MINLEEDRQQLIRRSSDAVIAVAHAGGIVAGKSAHFVIAVSLQNQPVVERGWLLYEGRSNPAVCHPLPRSRSDKRGL